MWNLITKEWMELIDKKRVIGFVCLVSIIFIIGTSYIAFTSKVEMNSAPVTIGVADCDNSLYSNMLLDYFSKDANFSKYATLKEGSEQQLDHWIHNGEIDAYLVLPEKFAENLIRIEHVPVEVKISTENSTTAIVLKNVLLGYERYISAVEINAVGLYEIMKKDGMPGALLDEKNEKISIDLVFTALGRDSFFEYVEDDRVSYSSVIEYYQYAMLSILILYLGMVPGMKLLKEREEKIWERIIISSIKGYQYILAKWLFYTMVFSSMLLIFLLSFHILNKKTVQWNLLLFIILAIGVSILLSLCLASLCKKRRMFLLSGNIIYLMFSIVGGSVIPIMYMPERIYILAKFTPNYWFMKFLLSL